MILETVDISDISQDPANVRKHSERNLESIAASLRAFGQQKPIVVDKRGVILAGNGTYEAAKRIGWDKIKITRTDLSGTLATAYAIADNRTAELAEWDDTALAEQLRALQSEEFNLANVGYTDDEVQQLIDGIGNGILGASEVTEDEIPEPPIEPITKPGDLWLLGEHRLLCGDSTKAEDVARLMDGAKADMCFTSPPYNAGTFGWESDSKYDGDEDDRDDYGSFLNAFCMEAVSACAVAIVNIQQLSGNKTAFVEWMHRWRNHLVDVAIWDKGGAEPAMEPQVMNSAFEYLVFLSSQQKPSRKIPMSSWRGTMSNIYRGGKQTKNEYSAVHRATFPVHLPTWGMTVCDEARSVYEPFCGTGTTLIAAEQLGRKCYGMEISPQYCDVIVKRWETLTGRVATRA